MQELKGEVTKYALIGEMSLFYMLKNKHSS